MASIQDKYVCDENSEREYGFIVFVSESPECKLGMFPPIMTLCDFDIEAIGSNGINTSRLSHISELDLTDNLISDWSEVLKLLTIFKSLKFLNLSNNLLSEKLNLSPAALSILPPLPLRKLVLNGNKLDWRSVHQLTSKMPYLEEIHLSNNSLPNPDGSFRHESLTKLFLTCNDIDSFEAVYENLGMHCPALEMVSLAECPLKSIPSLRKNEAGFKNLVSLNLTTTKISSWEDIDRLRTFPKLTELRFKNAPLLEDYTAHEKRMFMIARLPNILVLNGGDRIPINEREDSERAFIRFYMDVPHHEQPERYHEALKIHGKLDPLVNINLSPDTHVKVQINHKDEEVREEVISLYQTVQQFKTLLHQWFDVPVQNMKLFYCDQVMSKIQGPEEMKWPQKELYTYNVRDGDSFILDEKVSLGKQRTRNLSFTSQGSPTRPYNTSKTAITFGMSPMRPGGNIWSPYRGSPKFNGPSAAQRVPPAGGPSGVARNLFGRSNSDGSQSGKQD